MENCYNCTHLYKDYPCKICRKLGAFILWKNRGFMDKIRIFLILKLFNSRTKNVL